MGVSTDTRTLKNGELFIALRGERFDGHDFLDTAQKLGAAALLVHRFVDSALPQIRVADTERALGAIAKAVRTSRSTCVIGITGSNGKTTVKTLVASILSLVGRTHVNAGNLNNEIGLPLSLLAEPVDTKFGVYEMGAGKPGDIAYLAAIAQPQIGLVNNIAPAHLERMGSLQGVAQTKAALYAALPDDGIAVINADDAFASYFTSIAQPRRILRFGLDNPAHVTASEIELAATTRFTLRTR
jgi:UDP-N-acetylmuramoyl-tripeptide--D-alanyl-D-alanine ligase